MVCYLLCGEQTITVSGYVKDAGTKEALIGATLVNVKSGAGTSSNTYGCFTLTSPKADTLELLISYQGYARQAKKISAGIKPV